MTDILTTHDQNVNRQAKSGLIRAFGDHQLNNSWLWHVTDTETCDWLIFGDGDSTLRDAPQDAIVEGVIRILEVLFLAWKGKKVWLDDDGKFKRSRDLGDSFWISVLKHSDLQYHYDEDRERPAKTLKYLVLMFEEFYARNCPNFFRSRNPTMERFEQMLTKWMVRSMGEKVLIHNVHDREGHGENDEEEDEEPLVHEGNSSKAYDRNSEDEDVESKETDYPSSSSSLDEDEQY